MAAAAAPVVLDLLGMDPNPSESGGGGAANGGASVEGEGANEPGDAPLMLTAMAPLPSMMGPVGAARGAASEMAALCGEVSFVSFFSFSSQGAWMERWGWRVEGSRCHIITGPQAFLIESIECDLRRACVCGPEEASNIVGFCLLSSLEWAESHGTDG